MTDDNNKLWKGLTALTGIMAMIIIALISYIYVSSVSDIKASIVKLQADIQILSNNLDSQNSIFETKLGVVTDKNNASSSDIDTFKRTFSEYMESQKGLNADFREAIVEFKVAIAEMRRNP